MKNIVMKNIVMKNILAMKKENGHLSSKKKKRPYPCPVATELTPEEAKQFAIERGNCSDQEATGLLESLRREQQQNQE